MDSNFTKYLSRKITLILKQTWRIRKGYKIPKKEAVPLSGGGVQIDATFLYSDLVQSSHLVSDFQQKTAAKVIKAFVIICSRIITRHKGIVGSIDGDRVMGIFEGDKQVDNAVIAAFQINYIIKEILSERLNNHFTSLQESSYEIGHCTGIDRGKVLAVRGGHSGSNDLIWIGRPASIAAKLSDIRHSSFRTIITEEVYTKLSDNLKVGVLFNRDLWQKKQYSRDDEDITIYGSGHSKEPS